MWHRFVETEIQRAINNLVQDSRKYQNWPWSSCTGETGENDSTNSTASWSVSCKLSIEYRNRVSS